MAKQRINQIMTTTHKMENSIKIPMSTNKLSIARTGTLNKFHIQHPNPH